jgi:exosortase A-associated hydrolase 2
VQLKGGILHVHAFAEEMNKSRNVVARQARAFTERGWHVLLVDLLGCGDSSGDFAEATWERWLADLDAAAAWLHRQCGEQIALWGLRAGALLAADWVRRRRHRHPLLLWQPVATGAQQVQQLLRMKLAGGIVGRQQDVQGAGALRKKLREEGSFEVGGYTISADLVESLDGCALAPLPNRNAAIWLEVTSRPESALSPGASACADRLRSEGCEIVTKAVQGPAFWQSAYLEECPTLIEASTAALSAWWSHHDRAAAKVPS